MLSYKDFILYNLSYKYIDEYNTYYYDMHFKRCIQIK